jgi:hypothetical protein
MLRPFSGCLVGLALCALVSKAALAGGHSVSDYPLRVHIFQHNSHSHYYHQTLDAVDGEGRANLYENSEPRGFDFGYRCGERLRNSTGFDTYPARWKKRDQTLEILMPKLGKPGTMEACELHVEMKEIAYYKHDGNLDTEPTAAFKQWMEKHDYDPEHEKNEPVRSTTEQAGGGAQSPSEPQ